MFMIYVVGEILLDAIVSKDENIETRIGGAAYNVASNLLNLGSPCMFYGVVGDDVIGNELIKKSSLQNKKALNIQKTNSRDTSIAIFKKSDEGGTFSFIRKAGADYFYDASFLESIDLSSVTLFHFGSLFLSDKRARDIVDSFISKIKSYNILISTDVNIREDIFHSKTELKEIYKTFLKKVDIVKFTVDEILFLTDTNNLQDAIKYFNYLKLIIITDGANGSFAFYKGELIYEEALENVKVVDPVGAGDSFYSGVLSYIINKDIKSLSVQEIKNALKRGSKCAAKTLNSVGATNAYKSLEDIEPIN